MALFSVPNVKIAGVSACVPKNTEDNLALELLSESEREMFVKTIGIRYRRIAEKGTTAADLCRIAAEKLIADLGWQKAEISVLVFVSQTPDYIIPFTASTLQEQLGLSKNCLAFDVNLGCSGYVYGLSVVASLLQNIKGGKALLLVGDCSSSVISQQDKSVVPLFSDAGSATALVVSENEVLHFNLQTDGKEFDDIIIRDGGLRSPFTSDSLLYAEIEKGVSRNGLQMKLDGMKIFNFALREMPNNVQTLLQFANVELVKISAAYFHQANLLMNERVRQKTAFLPEKTPYSLHDFGNTSSASITVTIAAKPIAEKNVLLCGFGVGLSWGSALVDLSRTRILPLIEI
ncbi:MAG TPA: ketoacyl-ACP synthase III [Chitinophagales bacterium]